MNAPIDVARQMLDHLGDDERRALAAELIGKPQPRSPDIGMRMCKYCGGIIRGKGMGPRRAYCQLACWTAARGFDGILTIEHARGKESFDLMQAHLDHSENKPVPRDSAYFTDEDYDPGVTMLPSDKDNLANGADAMEAVFDRLDGTTPGKPRLDLAELLRKAKNIHPLLPSIMAMLADGATQMEIARKLKVSQSVISEAIKTLRTSHGY